MGSIGVTFFAFAGYGVITNAAGDVKNPQRTITWGIFLTILIVIGLYLALAFVALHFIPAKELMANADIAVAVAANRLMGDWGYALMYITAVIAFISGIGATYFSIFRISYALAQQHILPEFYHRRFWPRRQRCGLILIRSSICPVPLILSVILPFFRQTGFCAERPNLRRQ